MNIDFTDYLSKHSPGYVIDIYNNGETKEFIIGNRITNPDVLECNSDTLYDIASLTKTYTATLIYIAYEENKINIYDMVKNIDNRFINLDNVRVIDLLSHNQEIWTDGYLGSADSKNEYYRILFSSMVKSENPTYVDTHYIILSTILEKLYNKKYEEILQEKILDRLNLKNTTVNPISDNVASNNYELLNGNIIDYIYPGLTHDNKARNAKRLNIITGHASIFTTASDLLEFLKSFLNYKLLKKETIDLMLQHNDINNLNYTKLIELGYSGDINDMYNDAMIKYPDLNLCKTYNFMGTRYKNDINDLNDVPLNCSNNSIAFSGYTGPMYVVDFNKKIIVVIMCNVMHNTRLDRKQRKKLTEKLMNEIFDNIL